ncbi:MAG TPA: cation transporter [Actinomycetaceae bacterium]|nr:cation transporter [Actinomycetaceae bacterium]
MTTTRTTVLEVGGLHWATSEAVIEKTLLGRPGVLAVHASAASQSATVTYDRDPTSVAQLVGWVNDCGYHCAGQSVPDHMCHPMAEPAPSDTHAGHAGHDSHEGHGGHSSHVGHEAHAGHADHGDGEEVDRSAQAVMGHGGHHGGGSMEDMARDMRNRFLVALVLAIPITIWSPLGRDVPGLR